MTRATRSSTETRAEGGRVAAASVPSGLSLSPNSLPHTLHHPSLPHPPRLALDAFRFLCDSITTVFEPGCSLPPARPPFRAAARPPPPPPRTLLRPQTATVLDSLAHVRSPHTLTHQRHRDAPSSARIGVLRFLDAAESPPLTASEAALCPTRRRPSKTRHRLRTPCGVDHFRHRAPFSSLPVMRRRLGEDPVT